MIIFGLILKKIIIFFLFLFGFSCKIYEFSYFIYFDIIVCEIGKYRVVSEKKIKYDVDIVKKDYVYIFFIFVVVIKFVLMVKIIFSKIIVIYIRVFCWRSLIFLCFFWF